MRQGLVYGKSLAEVLQHAASSLDRKVQWVSPKRPAVAAISQYIKLDLDKPAGTPQTLSTIKQMGVIAEAKSKAYVHALRSGAARDILHIKSSDMDGHGFESNGLRQALGHSCASQQRGVPEKYTDSPTSLFYNARVENKGFAQAWKKHEQERIELRQLKITQCQGTQAMMQILTGFIAKIQIAYTQRYQKIIW